MPFIYRSVQFKLGLSVLKFSLFGLFREDIHMMKEVLCNLSVSNGLY